MSYRKLKKYLKRNTGNKCCHVGDYSLEWFINYYHQGYWLISGVDYWGEAWDQQIMTKDVHVLLKENKKYSIQSL